MPFRGTREEDTAVSDGRLLRYTNNSNQGFYLWLRDEAMQQPFKCRNVDNMFLFLEAYRFKSPQILQTGFSGQDCICRYHNPCLLICHSEFERSQRSQKSHQEARSRAGILLIVLS